MSPKYTIKVIKETVKLLKEYESQKQLCPKEFLDSKKIIDLPEEIATIYFCLIKHHRFFNELLDYFWKQNQLKKNNKWTIQSLLYLLIFVLRKSNYEEIKYIFFSIEHKFTMKVIEFVSIDENIVFCARVGCKYFDNDYILKNVIRPLIDKEKLFKCLIKDLVYEYNEKANVTSKPVTIPSSPNGFKRYNVPPAPINSPQPTEIPFKATKLPNFINQSKRFEKQILAIKDKNREKAIALLERAQKYSFKCAYIKPKTAVNEVQQIPFKSTKIPNYKMSVPVKNNTTALMRQAAVLAKNRETELKKIEDLLSGAFDSYKIDRIEEEFRKHRHQQYLQDIEKKHLSGLLTFEESQLAKKKLFQANQEKMETFKEERLKILEEIYDWKMKEQEKIKGIVDKCHNIEQSARDAGKRLIEERQCNAKLVDYESRKLLQELHEKRVQELAEKAKLIQELRALHQLRSLNVKEFDPTECPNFGLMCEMSIAELRERLNLVKIEMREELEERKRGITEERQRKEHLIDNMKEFISQTRMSKPRIVPNTPPKLEQTAEIMALRERLQQAREINAVK